MSPSDTTTFERNRQYKPTYTSLPKSRSSINFGAPFLAPVQKTIPKSESSVNFGAHFPQSTKTAVRGGRNKSLGPFMGNESDLHSAPTVATSGLTASVLQMFMHPSNRLLTPTKIPSPTRALKTGAQSQQIINPTTRSDNGGFASHGKQTPKAPIRNQLIVGGDKSTPVLPTPRRKDRERSHNVNHQTEPRYRAPTPKPPEPPAPPAPLAQPAQPEPALTRTRTFQVLTSLSNSFSLSNLRKASSQLSLRGHTANGTRSSSGPAAFLSRSTRPSTPTHPSNEPEVNLRDVRTGMPQSYWAGRYRTLDDKFRSENFEIDYLESPAILEALKEIEKQGGSFEDDNMSNADQIRYRRVFAVLETHCKTPDAKKSLRSFQQAYARNLKCQQLLPAGGTIQEKENLFSRAGRFFTRNRAVSVLSDKRFMKNEKKAEGKMYRKKVMEKSLQSQKNLSNQYGELMEALRNEESCWEAGGSGV